MTRNEHKEMKSNQKPNSMWAKFRARGLRFWAVEGESLAIGCKGPATEFSLGQGWAR